MWILFSFYVKKLLRYCSLLHFLCLQNTFFNLHLINLLSGGLNKGRAKLINSDRALM